MGLPLTKERSPVPSIYAVQMDIPAQHEAEFNRIYDEDHIPTILGVPGVRGCRRYRLERSTQAGVPSYLAVYEIDDPGVVESPAWLEGIDLGEWKPKIRPHTTNRKHSVFRRIGGTGIEAGGKGHLFVVQMDIAAEHEAEFNRVYDSEHFPMLSKVPGVLSSARYRLENSSDPKMQRWLTVYEVGSPAVLDSPAWAEAGSFGSWATKIRPLTTERHHSMFRAIA
jgi:hypothetical protein